MIPIADEDRLLLIPGPTPVHREILVALSRPTISHTSPQLAELIKRTLERLNEIADNPGGRAFVLAGTGTLAQEAALLNFVSPDDRLLVASNGYFASRLHEIAQQHGLSSTLITADQPGDGISPEQLADAVATHTPTVVTFTHVETSTGVMAPLDRYMDVIRGAGITAIVDGVAAFAGVPEPMAELGIDVLLTGAQKALGAPPGLAIIMASPSAWEKRLSHSHRIPAYYADLTRWAGIMEKPETYFSTHPVNLMYALDRATELVIEEGLEARFARHRGLAQSFRDGLVDMSFSSFTNSDYLAPTLSAVRTPDGIAASRFRAQLYEDGVVAAGGLGDPDDRVLRFGHMGNISEAEIAVALAAIQRTVRSMS